MYRVKPNGNYNIVINDIGISINATNINGIEVSDDKVTTSEDLKRMVSSGYVVLEKVTTKATKPQVVRETTGTVPTAFVSVTDEDEITPDNVFVVRSENLQVNNGVAEVKTNFVTAPVDEFTMEMVKDSPLETTPTPMVVDKPKVLSEEVVNTPTSTKPNLKTTGKGTKTRASSGKSSTKHTTVKK